MAPWLNVSIIEYAGSGRERIKEPQVRKCLPLVAAARNRFGAGAD